MSERTDPAKAAPEGFALARHGLPLSGALPSLPHAVWLPVAVRGSTLGLPVLPAVATLTAENADEDELDFDADAVVAAAGRTARGASDDLHIAKPSQGVGPAADAPGGGLAPGRPSAADSRGPGGVDSPVAGAVNAAGAILLPAVPRAWHGPGGDAPELGGPGAEPLANALRPPAPRTVPAVAGLNSGQSLAAQQAGPQRHDKPMQRTPSPRVAEAGAASAFASAAASASAAHREPALPGSAAVQQRPPAARPAVAAPASSTTPAPTAMPITDARAVPAAADSRKAAEPTTIIVMGLPDAPAAATRGPAAPDLVGLLAPPIEATRTVRIDRVEVSLQTAPQPMAAASAASPPPASRAAAPSGAQAYRNPWASNHARRD